MAFEVKTYPPSEFKSKYETFLAPHGVLVPPKEVFKDKRLQNSSADVALRKAFRITLKKLKKLRKGCANCLGDCKDEKDSAECSECHAVQYCCDSCKSERLVSHAKVCKKLLLEKTDQILECLPSPVLLGKDILKGKGGPVRDWQDWFQNQTDIAERIKAAIPLIKLWWEFVGEPYVGDKSIQFSLERSVSNVFSTVLTIGHAPYWVDSEDNLHTSSEDPGVLDERPSPAMWSKRLSRNGKIVDHGREISIHLIGADKPEVSAIESGLIQVSSRILRSPLNITLVAPDLAHHPQTFSWSCQNPLKVIPNVKVSAFAGLYHDFWDKLIANEETRGKETICRPDLCIAIHPGVHTAEMFALWRPTLELLAQEGIPVVMTTYNEAEFDQTLKVITALNPVIKIKGENPYGSLQWKQTPYEPDHVWASNSYLIVILNKV